MNQSELVIRLKMSLNSEGITSNQIHMVLEAFKKTILDATSNGEAVSMKHFGRFVPRMLKGKILNKTGITWTKDNAYNIPDRAKLGFKSSPLADQQVNNLIKKLDV